MTRGINPAALGITHNPRVPPDLQAALDERAAAAHVAGVAWATARGTITDADKERARRDTRALFEQHEARFREKVDGILARGIEQLQAIEAAREAREGADAIERRVREKMGTPAKRRRVDRETPEQIRVVEALRAAGIRTCAIPNGGGRTAREGAELQRLGVTPGAPDLVIWDPPPALPGKVGMALEMKRADAAPKTARAGRWSGATVEQREWLDALEARGWHCAIGYGAEDALERLRAAGYGV